MCTRSRHFLGAALAVLCLQASAVSAMTITVTTPADDLIVNGNCTLREALIAANTDTAVDACPAGHGPDIILRACVSLAAFEAALRGLMNDGAVLRKTAIPLLEAMRRVTGHICPQRQG